MTLNDYLNERHNLSNKRRVEACKKFLIEMSNSDVNYLTKVIEGWMGKVAYLEDDDFFGTEGMNI